MSGIASSTFGRLERWLDSGMSSTDAKVAWVHSMSVLSFCSEVLESEPHRLRETPWIQQQKSAAGHPYEMHQEVRGVPVVAGVASTCARTPGWKCSSELWDHRRGLLIRQISCGFKEALSWSTHPWSRSGRCLSRFYGMPVELGCMARIQAPDTAGHYGTSAGLPHDSSSGEPRGHAYC